MGNQYIYLATTVLTAVIAPLVTLWIYRRRTRIDLSAQEDQITIKARQAVLEAQQIPIQLLKDELGKRESELSEIRAQDRSERIQFVTTLQGIEVAVTELAKDTRSLREEERVRAGKIYDRVDEVDDRLIVIETKLKIDAAPKKRGDNAEVEIKNGEVD